MRISRNYVRPHVSTNNIFLYVYLSRVVEKRDKVIRLSNKNFVHYYGTAENFTATQ